MLKVNIEEFAKQLHEAAEYLAKHKSEGGCYRFHTTEVEDNDIDKDVSIVLGWTDGFDPSDKDKDRYQDDPWRLAVKVCYQPIDSIKQCDYDVDFNQVYYEETGEVYDTEITIYENSDFTEIAKDIVSNFNYIITNWNGLCNK